MRLSMPRAHKHISAGIVGASSSGTTVTTGASAHTKGSYVSIVDPIPDGITGFWVVVQQASDAHRWAFDIATEPTGGGTAEIVCQDLWAGWKGGHGAFRVRVNLPLPAGRRLSCRAQSSGTSAKTSYVSAILLQGGGMPSLGKMTTYGIVTSGNTRGVEVDAGGSADTKGSYAQISASTSERIRELYVAAGFPQSRTGTPTIATRAYFLADIAIGAGGSELPVISDLPLAIDEHSDSVNGDPLIGPFEVDIPEGSRIAIRMQSSTASDDAGDHERRLDFGLYGVR